MIIELILRLLGVVGREIVRCHRQEIKLQHLQQQLLQYVKVLLATVISIPVVLSEHFTRVLWNSVCTQKFSSTNNYSRISHAQ